MKKENIFVVTRMIGARALQIAAGVPALVDKVLKDPISLAKEELKEGIIPIKYIGDENDDEE